MDEMIKCRSPEGSTVNDGKSSHRFHLAQPRVIGQTLPERIGPACD
jgi:hypothetical protein